jgi:hypothetical protein
MAGDFEPADDPDLAQARLLLASLWEHVGDTSRKIEAVEARVQSMTPGTGPHVQHRRQAEMLRRELYETHRLIEGLHRRFPHTAKRTGRDEAG